MPPSVAHSRQTHRGGDVIELHNIPVPPSLNQAYRALGRGKVVTAEAAEKWKRRFVENWLALGKPKLGLDREPYWVHIQANINHKRDLDNLPKLILDVMAVAEITPKDHWCDRLLLERCKDPKPNHMHVTVEVPQ